MMTPVVSEPIKLPTYTEIADGLLQMAQSLLALRQGILQVEAAAGDRQPVIAEMETSHSQIIEESVKEIPKDELDSLFEQTGENSPPPPGPSAISSVSVPESEHSESVTPPSIKEEDSDDVQKLLMLVSSGGMQPDSKPFTAKTFGEICDLGGGKQMKEKSLSPCLVDGPVPVMEEPAQMGNIAHGLQALQQPSITGRIYECDQCPKKFANKFLLKKHQFIHTGAQPFKCDLCSRSFNRKDNMVRHRKTPHNNTYSAKDTLPVPTVAPLCLPAPVEIQEYLATAMSSRMAASTRYSPSSSASSAAE